jgi:predicted esterase
MIHRLIAVLAVPFLLATFSHAQSPFPRTLPPMGVKIPDKERGEIEAQWKELTAAFQKSSLSKDALRSADVAARLKAVDFALRHGEFFKPDQTKIARAVLDDTSKLLAQSASAKKPGPGLHVWGFYSKIDGSPQVYGVEIPSGLDLRKPVPVWIWLHGRGDTQTDMFFIEERLNKKGQFSTNKAVILHPFGRQCLGYKGPGQTDVMEALEALGTRMAIDHDKIVMAGFSMGGAGAWHLGAHFAGQWCAVHAGAGFVDVQRYQNLTPEKMPPWYEQTLWGVYDVPLVVHNLFNTRPIAYSGEDDKQKQAADIMAEAFEKEGKSLDHIVGPKTGHKYHPEALAKITQYLEWTTAQGREGNAREVHWQSRTLRYATMKWIRVHALTRHWEDSQVHAKWESDESLVITTKNVEAFQIAPRENAWPARFTILVDGQSIPIASLEKPTVLLTKANGKWVLPPDQAEAFAVLQSVKKPGLQGPIDDAFLEAFLVVTPDTPPANPLLAKWVTDEIAYLKERWETTFRGTLRLKKASEVTAEDAAQYHLILWGDPAGNKLLADFLKLQTDISWTADTVKIGEQSFAAATHVPVLIRPNLSGTKYLVINSGPTHREAHNKTNSLQNPKLPDWAVIDLQTPADGEKPGAIAAAGFWDESWLWQKSPSP